MSKLTVVKKIKNLTLFKDERDEHLIRIDNVRLSYPFLGKPSVDEGDDGTTRTNWRLVGMLNKETHQEAYDFMVKEIKSILTKNEAKVQQDKWFLQDGDEKEDPNMADHWLVTASDSKNRPSVRDAAGRLFLDPKERDEDEIEKAIMKIDNTFYGGCWGHILIRPWYFNGKAKTSTKTYPKRVSANLVGVLFAKDDKPFGSGRVDESDAWGDVKQDAGDGFDDMDDDDDI